MLKMRNLLMLAAGVAVYRMIRSAQRKHEKYPHIITSEQGDAPNAPTRIEAFQIISPAFAPGRFIPKTYACDGQDISPPLQISGVPAGTKSLALILDDPDSPMPPIFDHWLVWNIPADTTEIPEGGLPIGAVQGTNSVRNVRYNGPCTPNGTHHYHFQLFALDCMLDLPEGASKQRLKGAMKGHILAKSEMLGLYRANPVTRKNLMAEMAGAVTK